MLLTAVTGSHKGESKAGGREMMIVNGCFLKACMGGAGGDGKIIELF